MKRKAVDAKKSSLRLQGLLCMVLILISLGLSFLPIFSVEFKEEEVEKDVIGMINDMADAHLEEIPEKVDVKLMNLINAFMLSRKILVAMTKSDGEEGTEAKQALNDYLFEEDGSMKDAAEQTLLTVAGIVRIVMVDGLGRQMLSFSAFGLLIRTIVVIVAVWFLLFFVLFLPVLYLFKTLFSIVPAFGCFANPSEKAVKIAKRLIAMSTLGLSFMMIRAIIPGVALGKGALLLWGAALAGVFVSFLASRMRPYEKTDRNFVNVLQATSAFSLAGTLLYFLNGVKGGVFESFLLGPWPEYTVLASETAAEQASQISEQATVSPLYLLDGLLIILALIFFMSSARFFGTLVRRLTLKAEKKELRGDAHVGRGVTLVLSIIFTFLVSKMKHNVLMSPEEEPTSFLILTKQQTTSLAVALIGAIVVLISEILLVILRNRRCVGMKPSDRITVMTGNAPLPEPPEGKD